MNNLQNNIKNVMIVFLLLFMGLISYISYNTLFKNQQALDSVYNKRTQAEKSKVLRGSIYDRDMNPLAVSTKTGEFSQTRQYTGGVAFSHVVGYNDVKYGASGIEKKFDKDLSNQTVSSIKDIFSKKEKEDKVGNNVITTLNTELQQKAFEVLGKRKGSVVAIDPKTGEVLAMVSKPSFDANTIQEDFDKLSNDENRPFFNRAVSGLYPPGSVFKVITALSALENIPGVQDRTFSDKGKIDFNKTQYLENNKGVALGNINLRTAFTKSSNVVFGTLAMELGNATLRETAEKFFFNKDIPSRTLTIDNSVFPEYNKEEVGNIAQSGIGQSGVLASPIEMALVASAIANNGVMMEPNIVKEVTNPEGKVIKTYEPKEAATVTTPENAAILKEYMKAVVNEGTGSAAK
ncbi:MAG: penicillin-binding transpeptidase domain-containing protein, partial [Clostridium sp.]